MGETGPAGWTGWIRAMGIGITKTRQIKIPVTGLVAGVRRYRDLLDLDPVFEFFEERAVRGVVLLEPDADLHISLRDRRFRASAADWASPTPSSKTAARTEPPALDVPDPDPGGTVLRFLHEPDSYPRGFIGIEFALTAPRRRTTGPGWPSHPPEMHEPLPPGAH